MYKKLNENNFEKPERGKVVSEIGKYNLQDLIHSLSMRMKLGC
jgi:hypothetical protein